jgi:hypothetical protein
MKQKKNKKTIVVVARQAGTANAFLPLFDEFRKSNFNVKTFAFTHAHKIFASNKIEATLIERFDNSLLSNVSEPSFLLTGTSEYADEDNFFWQWAKNKGIPSLAFVDSWVSYWQRFTPNEMVQNKFSYTPDIIAVIDQFMYDRMVENGCDEKLLIITGNPAIDELQHYVPKEQENIVRKYGKGYFLFIGEPFNKRVFGGNERDVLGYTEAEVLELTADALGMLEKQNFKFVYRPHPRGCSDGISSIIDNHSNIIIDTGEFNSRDLVACAKAVIGMTSILLYEASVMGMPAISIQPNKKLSSDLIDYCCEIPVVTSSGMDEVCSEMKKILSAKPELRYAAKSTLCDKIRSIINNNKH